MFPESAPRNQAEKEKPTDLPDADETLDRSGSGTNYSVGVLEDGVIKQVDYSSRSPDEARQACLISVWLWLKE